MNIVMIILEVIISQFFIIKSVKWVKPSILLKLKRYLASMVMIMKKRRKIEEGGRGGENSYYMLTFYWGMGTAINTLLI